MTKLTNRTVTAAKSASGDVFMWDNQLPGFGLRVKPSGVKSYIIQYRNTQNESRRLTIGRHGVIGPEKAREKARRMLQAARDGADPARMRDDARRAPTIADLADRYLEQHAIPKKRPRSVASDKVLLRLHILPALGRRKAASIKRLDVANLHHAMKDTPGAANRTLALLSKMMNLAEKWGWRLDGSNPCRHVDKNPENKLERFLSGEELACLGIVLAAAERTTTEMPSMIAAIRLLVFTGARLGEILTLRWQDVDFDQACLRLSESKTGKKLIYLNAPALEVLNGNDRANEWVFVGRKAGQPLVNIRKAWYRIRDRATIELWSRDAKGGPMVRALEKRLKRPPSVAEIRKEAKRSKVTLPKGIDDVRLHDLRHSFASIAVAGGLSLPIIGTLLGHTQTSTTARYAHLADDPLRQANDMIGEHIAAAMRGGSAKVVEIKTAK